MKRLTILLTASLLCACSTTDRLEYSGDNTFITKPTSLNYGKGDKHFLMTFVNEYNIAKKITSTFSFMKNNVDVDLCESDEYPKQIGKGVTDYKCPFFLHIEHFTGNQYRVSVSATFLNGFRVRKNGATSEYHPITIKKDFSGILSMDANSYINLSISDRP